ncbi:MAG: hypothetical protein ACYS14_03165 [Planctomycetota bacterium]|jgi:uncharacterized membrane protein YraQ (UPF0718 family)
MNRRSLIKLTGLVSYLAFIAVSAVTDSSPGKGIGSNFVYFWADLIKVLPFAFVLIGLFEVWVSRETVERHLGEESRATGYLWALVLSGITVGGVFAAQKGSGSRGNLHLYRRLSGLPSPNESV